MDVNGPRPFLQKSKNVSEASKDGTSLWESWRPDVVQTEADERIGGHIGTLDVAHERIGGQMREFTSKA